ncbi:signal transduction histidine kinase [Devosia lucknowensis]|uniref:histidine kinase n=1 Tax=Devosia lucknowensis TaxID=1096929 RepID=A0A1Y6ENQ0_9HYPH|nr:histidine kinase dimerization/phosphoacceptor domain -containing protein [Devosia lucknowensis]SMQ63929.1 signal transduction histidine kinase [Devosia lucknowensis]
MGEATLTRGNIARSSEVRAATVAAGFIVLCVAAFASVFAFFVFQGIAQTRTQLEERSQAAAQVVATNAGWMAQVANQTLRRVDAMLGPTLSTDPQVLEAAVQGLPGDIDVYIIDADANTLFSTVDGAENVSVADREYFTALEAGATSYTSGMLVSRLTNQNIFVFSRRLSRDGSFAGAVMVSFTDALVQSFWSYLDLEPGSTISLIRRDGLLMARFPSVSEAIDLSDHVLITDYLPQSEAGTYFSEASPVDGISRVVSYRAVPGTEILALASIATNKTWDDMRGAIIAVMIIAAPILVGLIVGGLWIIRLLRRDAARREELEAANETNVLLFREIHHRVKNNLQSVQSLVRMQDMPKNAKIDLQSRLSAMAAMHEHIYKHDRYEDIDAHDLVRVVVDEVIHAYGADVAVNYELDHAPVDRDHATPLSLLLSELVTNALKYAFADGRQGAITVTLRDKGGGRADLIVADDGVGIGEVPDAPASMGLRLIRGVVSQMGGTYRYVSENGTRFEGDLALATGGHVTRHWPERD